MDNNNNTKLNLGFIGMLVGLGGALMTLIALFVPAYKVTTILGTITVSPTKILGALMAVYFVVIGLSALYSILRMGKSNIVAGAIDIAFTVFAFAIYENNLSKTLAGKLAEKGPSFFLFVIGGIILIVSGVMIVIGNKNDSQPEVIDEETREVIPVTPKNQKAKKAINVVSIIMAVIAGLFAVIMFIGLVFGKSATEANVKKAATSFMDAAVAGSSDEIGNYVTDNLTDRNGFMEAYDAELLIRSLLAGFGGEQFYDQLTEENLTILNESMQTFAQNYVTEYKITNIECDDDKHSGTVTMTVTMFNENGDFGIDIASETATLMNDYLNNHLTELSAVLLTEGQQGVAIEVMNQIMPDLVEIYSQALTDMGTTEAEITLTVEEVDEQYLISSIVIK